MTDKELLELAAKAAGIETTLLPSLDDPNRPYSRAWELEDSNWNPLESDADAFQLMVKLSYMHRKRFPLIRAENLNQIR